MWLMFNSGMVPCFHFHLDSVFLGQKCPTCPLRFTKISFCCSWQFNSAISSMFIWFLTICIVWTWRIHSSYILTLTQPFFSQCHLPCLQEMIAIRLILWPHLTSLTLAHYFLTLAQLRILERYLILRFVEFFTFPLQTCRVRFKYQCRLELANWWCANVFN